MFLMAMILGMLAEDDTIRSPQNDFSYYAQFAFQMLSEVTYSDGLESVQCLILVRCRLIVSFANS